MRISKNLVTLASTLSLLVCTTSTYATINNLLKANNDGDRQNALPYAIITGLTAVSWLYFNERRKLCNSQLNHYQPIS